MPHSKKVILIGYGEISRKQHHPVISSLDEFELSAIVDPIFKNEAESYNAIVGDCKIYPNLDEAFSASNQREESQDVVVVIACPPEFAQDYAAQTLISGSSVFMEKPPGFDCRRLSNLEEIAKNKKLTIFTGYHSVFSPQINNAKKWISNGKPLKKVTITWKESIRRWHPNFQNSWIVDGKFGVLDILFNPMSIIDELLGADALRDFHLDSNNSSLTTPENWSGPISGTSTFRKSGSQKCSLIANFAWDHPFNEEDVWTISFESYSGQNMEIRDGGARIFVDGLDVSSNSLRDGDILRPEYEGMYHRFMKLIDSKACEVRIGPLQVMLDILDRSKTIVTQKF